MEWIVVTRTADREKIFVNANQIFAVYRNYSNKDVTIIDSVGDCENYIEVLESPEAIMNLLKGEVTE